jgi:molybdopterin-guanine dinucleotide biosynthesis protein A
MNTIDALANEFSSVSLAVIAGGKGQRMGMPKAWLRIKNQSILAWLFERLRWPGPTMLISSASYNCPPDANIFTSEYIDSVNGQGPLRAILTALEYSVTSILVILSVDMPYVDTRTLKWLARELAMRPSCQGLMCQVNQSFSRKIEPLPSAFRIGAIDLIKKRLDAGQCSIQGLCEVPEFCAIPAPDDWSKDTWVNLNYPHQLASFLATLTDPSPGNTS